MAKNSMLIIVPVLNEANNIFPLLKKIFKYLKNKKKHILFIDDNSTDGTIDQVKNIAKSYDNIKLLVRQGLKKNLANSINLGIQNSKYENVIWMDADFQHPPEYIKLFHDFQKNMI